MRQTLFMFKISIVTFVILVIFAQGIFHVYSQSEDLLQESEEKKNKDIIIAFTEAFNQRNISAIDLLVAENITEHRPGAGQGREATKGFLMALQTAFPDFETKLDHIIAEGDKVVVFTNTTGTHQGPFVFAPNIEPTGKELSFRTADIYRIEDGQIVEHWDVIEIMDMLMQMGAINFTAQDNISR